MKANLKTIGIGALAALFLAGCGGAQEAPAPAEEPAQEAPAQETGTQEAATDTQSQAKEGEITSDEAKQIALTDAGVAEADAVFDDIDYEQENGKAIYEISFDVGTQEYEYDIDAATGDILKSEVDNN